METLEFTATQAGFVEEPHSLIVALSTNDPSFYVCFQRDVEGSDEDWGVYLEFNDQINGGYECIRHCSLSRERLHIDLTKPFDSRKIINVIDVNLQISDADYVELTGTLRQVFRERESFLTIADDAR